MTSIPVGFSIATPINRAVGAAPALGIGPGFGGAVTQLTSKSTAGSLSEALTVNFIVIDSQVG